MINIVFVVKLKFLVGVKCPPPPPPPIILIIDPIITAKIFWAHYRPISFKHISFWCLFLHPHLFYTTLKNGICPIRKGEHEEVGIKT